MRLLLAGLLVIVPACPGPPDSPTEANPGNLMAAVRPAPPAPPAPVGLWDQPFAPEGLDACQTMTFYRIQWGLPERFDRLGFRESRCTNTPTSRTGCCVGFWQLHKIIWRDHRMIDRLANCQATWLNVRGADPLSMQRQACAAKQLFDVAGYSAWAL